MNESSAPPSWVRERLRHGLVIPAHPLALTDTRKFDERRQRALTRYYHAAGAGGLAIGVHMTQFAIRDQNHGLLIPVLKLGAQTAAACDQATQRQTVLIAGICGPTDQAVAEARLARELGYHAGLLSLASWRDADLPALLAHCRRVAEEIAVFGFYLSTQLGGRPLPFPFWQQFVEIPNVAAIKIAPFDRYETLAVVRAVAEAGRAGDIALYTGNDDNIIPDLLAEYELPTRQGVQRLGIVGGLLGQWACGTRRAVEQLEACRQAGESGTTPGSLLTLAAQLTDLNAALFDSANQFRGSIPGVHEILRRQGLLANLCCLDPRLNLSPGQAEEIDRVYRAYPHLHDDVFVAEHLNEWL
jgi:dihydrodipicolinate synthase/N-acetylneuraminate lyase